MQLYVGSCAEAIDPELLALVRDELETSGFEVDSSEAELHVSVAPACRGREARVSVTDGEGRMLASREIPVGGVMMQSRVIALGTAEILREVIRGEPGGAESERELESTRAALESERSARAALEGEQALARERALQLADENARLAAIEAERARRSARPPARSRVRLRSTVAVFDGAVGGGGELGGDLAVAHEWTVGAWLGALGTTASTELGDVWQVSLDLGAEALFWVGHPDELSWFVGPSVAGGASLAWGRASRSGVESAAASAFHLALAAATGVMHAFGAWTLSLGVRGGYVVGGLEPSVDGRLVSGLRGVFLSIGLEVGWSIGAE